MSMYSTRGEHCILLTHSVCTGLHDAVEKGYLETMTFGLCRDKEQTDLVEQFQYKFAYESDIVTMADSFGTDVAIPLSQSSQVYHLSLCTISIRQNVLLKVLLLELHTLVLVLTMQGQRGP